MNKPFTRLLSLATAVLLTAEVICTALPAHAASCGLTAQISTIAKSTSFQLQSSTATFLEGAAVPSSRYVTVNSDKQGQTMLGLGGAMTESAAYNISKLTPAQQAEVYEAYFGESGAKYALSRLTIGSADFSTRSYSYDDSKTADPSLTQFSIAKDYDYIIPAVKRIQAVNPNTRFFAAPWAPPAWMKKSGKRQGGVATGGLSLVNNSVLPKYYQSYADYLTKYVQAYAQEGIPIYSLSMQNEVQNNPSWECATWSIDNTINFISNYLGPTLERNNIQTKLVIWDWDKGNDTMHKDGFINFNTGVLSNANARKYIDGIAFHWYAGDLWHELSGNPMWSEDFYSLDRVKAKFPDIHLYATEACQEKGPWFGSYEPAYRYIHDILNDFEHGTECFIDWNLVLDANGGPTQGVENKCHAPIMLDKNNNICYQPSYYVLKMISRAVQPGTVHITTASDLKIDKTAVINSDGTISVLLGNTGNNAQTLTLMDGVYSLQLTLPANSLTTVTYQKPIPCTHASTQLVNALTPSCGADGYTGNLHCQDCGKLISSGITLPATGKHSWDAGSVITAPTETEAGTKQYSCKNCSAVQYASIPALGSQNPSYAPITQALTNQSAASLLDKETLYVYHSETDAYYPVFISLKEENTSVYTDKKGNTYPDSEISTRWTSKNGRTYPAASAFVTSSLVTYTRTHKTSLLTTYFWYVNDRNSSDVTARSTSASGARKNFSAACEFRSDGAPGKNTAADDAFYVAAVYTPVTRVTHTTVQYTYRYWNGSTYIPLEVSSEPDTQCPIVLYRCTVPEA